ncbi:tRNA (guanine-N(7)-)-methyltransferase (tRNA(m7G46)-methyltransferase), partial [Coemansia erecta]
MYGAMLVTAARVLLGYALVAPLVLGGLVALLLGTNIAASYWFQRQRQRQNTSKHHAFSTIHAAAPRVVQKAWALAVDPPVPRIPRLQFASLLPRTIESSLFPTDFNARNVAATSGSNSNGDLLPMLALLFPLATHELLALLRLAVRDFVESWFGDISADPSFPRCVLYQMAQTVDAVVERAVERVDAAEVLVGQVLPIVTAHIHAVKECESACLDQDGGEHGADGANGLGGDEGVGRRISEMYAKSGSMRWHPALKGLEDIGGGGDQDRGDDERKRRVMAHVRKVVNLLVP